MLRGAVSLAATSLAEDGCPLFPRMNCISAGCRSSPRQCSHPKSALAPNDRRSPYAGSFHSARPRQTIGAGKPGSLAVVPVPVLRVAPDLFRGDGAFHFRSKSGSHPRVMPRLIAPSVKASCWRRCLQSSNKVSIAARASSSCQARTASTSHRISVAASAVVFEEGADISCRVSATAARLQGLSPHTDWEG